MFKRSAEKLSALVLAAKPGTVIAVNADKVRRQRRASASTPLLPFVAHAPLAPQPRKGAFVVRVRGRDAPLVALLVRAAQ